MRRILETALGLLLVAGACTQANAAEQILYCGTYTSGTSKGIYAWTFDDKTGSLTALGLAVQTPQPAHIWISADGRFLYAVNWEDTGGLSAFRIDPLSAKLTFLNRVSTRGSRPNQVVLSPTGQVAAAVNYATGNVVLYRVLPDGRLSDPTDADQHVGPARSAHGGPRAHGIAFSRDGRWMYVAELGLDRVYAYRIDPERAVARRDETAILDLHGGSGPRRLQLSADGRFLYVNHETDGEVSVLSVRGGQLAEIQRLSTLPPDFKGQNLTAEIVLGRDGRTLYVSNRGSDTIAVYRVNLRTGKLQLRAFTPSGGAVPRNLRIDPTGHFLLSANEKSGTITVLPIGTDGRLGTARVAATLDTPGGMYFVPGQAVRR